MNSARQRWYEQLIARAFDKAGLVVQRKASIGRELPVEATPNERSIISAVEDFTMTSSTRIWSLLQAVKYVHSSNVSGAIVECGVWRGGSMMAVALQLNELQDTERELWLYDTYEGMTDPTERDKESTTGTSASTLLQTTSVGDGNNIWCLADEADVRQNMYSTKYPDSRLHFVKGDVAETLTREFPDEISILRLDTDWYESTRVELEVLYSRLVSGGVCILDDYGHWLGARDAVDEFFTQHPPRPLISPIDFSGRIFIKP